MDNNAPIEFDKRNCLLRIDIDNISNFTKVLDLVSKRNFVFRRFNVTIKMVYVFSTAKGYHIYIELNKDEGSEHLTVEDKIFIQLILGSDNQRETFNWLRNKKGIDWNILFAQKFDKDGNLVSQEEYNKIYSERLFNSLTNIGDING